MLGRLLKYEIPALGRKLVPLYIAWAATAVLLGITVGRVDSKSEFAMVISGMLYAGVAAAVAVMAIIMIVQRYKNSLLGDEGYFYHVLPVTSAQHIASKTISALVWIVLSGVAMLLTGIIITIFSGSLADVIHDILDIEWDALLRNLGDIVTWQVLLVILEFIILMALSICKSVLAIYTALSLGHQARQRTGLASIGAYIGVLTFESFFGRLAASIFDLMPDELIQNVIQNGGFKGVQVLFLLIALLCIILAALYFFICKYLMEKRLNLA